MMLVEADPRRKRQVGGHAHEHAPPSLVIEIEVVLNDPALGELQMPAIGGSVADGDHDAGRLTRFQHSHDFVGLCAFEIGRDELVTTALRRFQNRDIALFRPWLQPLLKVIGNAMQRVPAHRI
jgi:hypothetical protein